jgi:DICT domain-containing protein/predicted DNA-binding transcriptional regulator AlpA
VSDAHPAGKLSIGDVSKQTGLAEATLRMWESRHVFPRPERLTSGHRRYSERDVELLRQVLEERSRGLSLKAAIVRVVRAGDQPERSLYAGLRRRRPELTAHLMAKRSVVALSHAIEDELVARAERAVLFGSFQEERWYRRSEQRWRELARTADYAVVLADFPRARRPRGAPVELPLDGSDPLRREWMLVCSAPGFAACLAGIERPGQDDRQDHDRDFDTLWSVEPETVHEAARIFCGFLAGSAAELSREIERHLDRVPGPRDDHFDVAAAVTSRMVAYLGAAERRAPRPDAGRDG